MRAINFTSKNIHFIMNMAKGGKYAITIEVDFPLDGMEDTLGPPVAYAERTEDGFKLFWGEV